MPADAHHLVTSSIFDNQAQTRRAIHQKGPCSVYELLDLGQGNDINQPHLPAAFIPLRLGGTNELGPSASGTSLQTLEVFDKVHLEIDMSSNSPGLALLFVIHGHDLLSATTSGKLSDLNIAERSVAPRPKASQRKVGYVLHLVVQIVALKALHAGRWMTALLHKPNDIRFALEANGALTESTRFTQGQSFYCLFGFR